MAAVRPIVATSSRAGTLGFWGSGISAAIVAALWPVHRHWKPAFASTHPAARRSTITRSTLRPNLRRYRLKIEQLPDLSRYLKLASRPEWMKVRVG